MQPTAPPITTMPRSDPCTTGSNGMKWTALAAGMIAEHAAYGEIDDRRSGHFRTPAEQQGEDHGLIDQRGHGRSFAAIQRYQHAH